MDNSIPVVCLSEMKLIRLVFFGYEKNVVVSLCNVFIGFAMRTLCLVLEGKFPFLRSGYKVNDGSRWHIFGYALYFKLYIKKKKIVLFE